MGMCALTGATFYSNTVSAYLPEVTKGWASFGLSPRPMSRGGAVAVAAQELPLAGKWNPLPAVSYRFRVTSFFPSVTLVVYFSKTEGAYCCKGRRISMISEAFSNLNGLCDCEKRCWRGPSAGAGPGCSPQPRGDDSPSPRGRSPWRTPSAATSSRSLRRPRPPPSPPSCPTGRPQGRGAAPPRPRARPRWPRPWSGSGAAPLRAQRGRDAAPLPLRARGGQSRPRPAGDWPRRGRRRLRCHRAPPGPPQTLGEPLPDTGEPLPHPHRRPGALRLRGGTAGRPLTAASPQSRRGRSARPSRRAALEAPSPETIGPRPFALPPTHPIIYSRPICSHREQFPSGQR